MGCGATKGKKYEANDENVPSAPPADDKDVIRPGDQVKETRIASEVSLNADEQIGPLPDKAVPKPSAAGGTLQLPGGRASMRGNSMLRVSAFSRKSVFAHEGGVPMTEADKAQCEMMMKTASSGGRQEVAKTMSRKSITGVLPGQDEARIAPPQVAEETAQEAANAAEAGGVEAQAAEAPAAQAEAELPAEEVKARWDETIDALREFLEEGGVNTEPFGKGTAKTIEQLMHEIKEGSTYLELQADGRVQRIVEPVFVQLVYNGCVLVQTEQQFKDGRKRKRKMMLAEKKEPGDCGGLVTTALRGIHEELLIPLEQLTDDILRYREDMYAFELEQLESPSYPGLISMYRTHYVRLDILEAGLEIFKHCGLPACAEFQTIETHAGSEQTHTWDWWTFEYAQKEKAKKFPPNMAVAPVDVSKDPDPASKDFTEENLKELLQADGVDTSKFGVGKAKALKALLKEVQEGSSRLSRNAQSGRWTRIVEPAFVQVIYQGKVLVEVAQILEDGRERKRKMLLAEKKEPADRDACDTSIRGIFEELGAPLEKLVLDEVVKYRDDLYCCQTEHLDSASYPGIPCCYYTHYCQVEVLEAGVEVFKDFGLPGGTDFETEEHTKAGTKKMQWSWWDLDYARQEKVKGMLKPPESAQEAGKDNKDKKVEYPVPVDIPADEASLQAVLEAGGVPVKDDWGMHAPRILSALLKELREGIGFLEKVPSSGKIVRVVKPAFIQLKWQGQLLVPEAAAPTDGAPPAEDAPSAEGAGDGAESSAKKETLEAELGTIKQLENAGSRNAVDFRADLNCFELWYFDSASYPGLHCVQRTKFVQFEQRCAEPTAQQEAEAPGASGSIKPGELVAPPAAS